MDHYDVIIIGSGAGGGTLAHQLSASGLRILLLERGEFVPREAENWSSREAVLHERYHARERWLDRRGREFGPGTHYCVGGNTKFYGAALFRMRERDFETVQHHGGVSPAWPISYADLEPWYAEAEALYEVRGERGEDPSEPPATTEYPHPAVSHEPRIQALSDHFSRRGLHPFHTPLGIRLDESDPVRSRCVRCRTCDGYPCLVGAKSDAQTMCVEPALRRGGVELLVGARALRLETDPSGTLVRQVVVERAGQIEQYAADLVVVSCGAVNSAALLLRSASDQHPEGLANGSGMVGRHYMAHNNSVLFAFCREPNPTRFQKSLSLNDFYFGDPLGGHGCELPLGHISMVGKFDGPMFRTGAPPFVPEALLDRLGRHSLDFWITSEDLPDPHNRVRLVADGGEGRVQLEYRENNLEAHRRLIARLRNVLRDFDGGWFFTRGGKVPLAGVAHQCGTLRFGTSPATSVLDINCRSHEVRNLYAVDASFFCSSSAVNPALTIMANALRVGDHILDEFGVSAEKHLAQRPTTRLNVLA